MKDKFFLDTNIIIYSFDFESRAKQKIATHLIENALDTRDGIISYQVIQEFLNVATRKFVKPLTTHDAKKYLQSVLIPLCHIYPDMDIYNVTLELVNRTNYSFYDSLILACALEAGCNKIYTEDLHDGHHIAGLKIINPF